MVNVNNIDLRKISQDLRSFENQWVAITEDTRIVASGPTYGETVRQVKEGSDVVLLKVPSFDASLAPVEA
ncbi:MAG: DUF5678 domain-containing protein [Patescibacteria group bacterium]